MPINYITAEQQRLQRVTTNIKRAIWLYFWLLIFEGALRKWVLPGFSSQLLLIRDPVAIWILAAAIRNGYLKRNGYLTLMVIVMFIASITTLTIGHQNLLIALYGARIFLIQFPLIFVIANVFNQADVEKIGRAMVWLTPPMFLLVTLQFYSPQEAFVNRGVGDDQIHGGFSGALGYYRPPTTFSFITGTTLFFSMAGAYILYFWFNASTIKRWYLVLATVSWLSAIPFCISRTLFFQTLGTIFFLLPVILRNTKFIARSLVAIIAVSVLSLVLVNFSFFQTAIAAFSSRFDAANEVEGGVSNALVDRILGGMVFAIQNSYNQPFWGLGLGMGTNVAAQLLTGKFSFLISEEEWGRLIGELGPLMGFMVIVIRASLSVLMARLSFKQVINGGNILPWMLLSVGFLNVAQGQWSPPTILGFSILFGGLILACFNKVKG